MTSRKIASILVTIVMVCSILTGGCLNAYAESIGTVSHTLPSSINIGSEILYDNQKISVSGLGDYKGYAFSYIFTASAENIFEIDPSGDGDYYFAVIGEDGTATVRAFMSKAKAVAEGIITIQPYVLEMPEEYKNNEMLYTLQELAGNLMIKAYKDETGLDYNNPDNWTDADYINYETWCNENSGKYASEAKRQCITVGEPITLTVASANKTAIDTAKSELQTLVNKSFKSTSYTDNSFRKYSEAVKTPNSVLSNSSATVEEIDNAISMLNNAINSLVKNNTVSPKTGDTSNIIILVLILGMSVLTLTISVRKIKQK